MITLIVAMVNAIIKWRSGKSFESSDQKINMFAMISAHIQLLFGLALYMVSPKVQFSAGWMGESIFRYFGMEHLLMMLIAILFITMGHLRSKKTGSHKAAAIPFILAFLFILVRAPWPFWGSIRSGWF